MFMQIQEYLEKTIKHLGIEGDFEIIVEETDDQLKIAIEVSKDDVALLIGNGGETLESLELLAKLSFKEEFKDKKISLDVNGYRQAQRERFVQDFIETAYRVLESKQEEVFEGLNSFERYLVHNAISSDSKLETLESFSRDEDGQRVLILRIKPEVA
jgi:spoIIIJ-associated protein